ncbi:hypothetical protein GQR58_027669 [Nymphon striatum]|nr:hypothetical protein GQR58_027669 [Nymphon striatum]
MNGHVGVDDSCCSYSKGLAPMTIVTWLTIEKGPTRCKHYSKAQQWEKVQKNQFKNSKLIRSLKIVFDLSKMLYLFKSDEKSLDFYIKSFKLPCKAGEKRKFDSFNYRKRSNCNTVVTFVRKDNNGSVITVYLYDGSTTGKEYISRTTSFVRDYLPKRSGLEHNECQSQVSIPPKRRRSKANMHDYLITTLEEANKQLEPSQDEDYYFCINETGNLMKGVTHRKAKSLFVRKLKGKCGQNSLAPDLKEKKKLKPKFIEKHQFTLISYSFHPSARSKGLEAIRAAIWSSWNKAAQPISRSILCLINLSFRGRVCFCLFQHLNNKCSTVGVYEPSGVQSQHSVPQPNPPDGGGRQSVNALSGSGTRELPFPYLDFKKSWTSCYELSYVSCLTNARRAFLQQKGSPVAGLQGLIGLSLVSHDIGNYDAIPELISPSNKLLAEWQMNANYRPEDLPQNLDFSKLSVFWKALSGRYPNVAKFQLYYTYSIPLKWNENASRIHNYKEYNQHISLVKR